MKMRPMLTLMLVGFVSIGSLYACDNIGYGYAYPGGYPGGNCTVNTYSPTCPQQSGQQVVVNQVTINNAPPMPYFRHYAPVAPVQPVIAMTPPPMPIMPIAPAPAMFPTPPMPMPFTPAFHGQHMPFARPY